MAQSKLEIKYPYLNWTDHSRIFVYQNCSVTCLDRVEIEEAKAGDLIAISGMEDIFVGETVTPVDHREALPVLHIDEPTLQMTSLTNNSPFAGREGKMGYFP